MLHDQRFTCINWPDKCDMKQGAPELDVIKDIPQGPLYHLCKTLLNLPFTYLEKGEPLEECGTYIDLTIVHFILYFNTFLTSIYFKAHNCVYNISMI